MYLLGVAIGRRGIAIPLAVDGGATATPNSIHLPTSKIIVDHVYIAASAPRHPLHQLLTKVIKCYSDLHP